MIAYPDLYVLRHGETEWNAAGRLQGWQDSPLTAQGVAQAERQAELLAGLDLSAMEIFTSDSGRARRTAQIALQGRSEAMVDVRLREIDVGAWTGQSRHDLRAAHPELFDEANPLAWYTHAPGGEGFDGVAARAAEFLDNKSSPCVIFTHGITSRILRCLALGLELDALGDLPGGQGVIHVIRGGAQDRLG